MSSTRKGRLSVRITDSPFSDAQAVLVTFSEVAVHRSGGGWQKVPFADGGTTRTCNLKQLEGPIDLLGIGSLPAGHYTQVRLAITKTTLYFTNAAVGGPCATEIAAPAGVSAPVKVPSDTLKLSRPFTLEAGGASTMLLDFDGDRSIKRTGNGSARKYLMTPVVRVVSVH